MLRLRQQLLRSAALYSNAQGWHTVPFSIIVARNFSNPGPPDIKLFMKLFFTACALLTLCSISGCGSEEGFIPEPAPSGLLRVLNAIPDSPPLKLNYENQPLGFVEFGTSTPFTQVLPEVNRSLRVSFIDDRTEKPLVSSQVRIPLDNLLTAIIAGTMANPEILLIEDVPPVFEEGNTISELRFAHVATTTTSTVNFHLTDDDAPAGPATASVSNNTSSELLTIESTENALLRVFSSEALALFDSGTFVFSASTRPLLVLLDYFGPGSEQVRVVSVAGATSNFPNEVITSSVRYGNMISDRTAVDMYLDGNLVADALLFGDVGNYQNLDAGDYTVTVTTANDIEDIITEQPFTAASGQFNTVIATGVGQTNNTLDSKDDLRRVPSRANVVFSNVAPAAGTVDLYILTPGQTVSNILPTIQNLNLTNSEDIRVNPGTYDIVLTQGGTSTVIFGAEQINVSPNGLYRLYFTDSAGGGEPIQVILGDDFTADFNQ